MNEFFNETPFVPSTPQAQPGEVARGPSWYVTDAGGRLMLHYLTGELVEREDRLEIDARELEALRSGARTVAEIVAAHGR